DYYCLILYNNSWVF
nr:immunoglobulin light chain junction region [Macaca mulatta]